MPTMKKLVVCCDGTWNRPDQVHDGVTCASNVTKIARCIPATDSFGVTQMLFYDKGVGTGRFDRITGGAFGLGIKRKILDAYRFLVVNYEPGDEIFFLGFSRGAYTVRSTYGLIRNSGLLRREYLYKLPDAYALYRRRDSASHPNAVESELFRRSYSNQPRAKFLGVWDTVGALGLPVGGLLQFINKRWSFHDMTLSSWVDNAFQALAIDEHRKPFQPCVWDQSADAKGQVLEQVWFAGVHSNVGGSYPQSGLSDITLLWMIARAQTAGLAIDRGCLEQVSNPKPDPLGTLYNSQTIWYRVFGLGDYIRPIGQEGNQALANTAVERCENSQSKYDPQNLKAYVEHGGVVADVRP
jgi:uncharacterized protein (DUF2235 family)